jgi:hypothetical protein
MSPFDFIKSVYHGVSQDLGNIFHPAQQTQQLSTNNGQPKQFEGATPPATVSSPQGQIPYNQSIHQTQNYADPRMIAQAVLQYRQSQPTALAHLFPQQPVQMQAQMTGQGVPAYQPAQQDYQVQNNAPADRLQYGNDATPLIGQLQVQNPQIQQLLQYYRGGL